MTISRPFYLFRRGRFYYVQYLQDGQLKQRSTRATRKGDAIAFVEQLRETFAIPAPKAMKLSSFISKYRELKAGLVRESTLIRTEYALRMFRAICGDRPLSSYEPAVVEKFRIIRLRVCQPTTVNIDLRHLRSAFGTAEKTGLLTKNPLSELRQVPIPERTPTILTPGDARALINSIADEQFRHIVVLAMLTGLRLGEVLSLRWSQVDLARRVLTIDNSREFLTKSGKIRTVPLNGAAVNTLRAQNGRRGHSGLVFPNRRGGRWSASYVSRTFKKRVRGAGLHESLHFHSLRHSFASWLIQSGCTLYEVQRLLGHSSIAVTQIYSHLSENQLFSAVGRLPEFAVSVDHSET